MKQANSGGDLRIRVDRAAKLFRGNVAKKGQRFDSQCVRVLAPVDLAVGSGQ
jgi:hypothetical protein